MDNDFNLDDLVAESVKQAQARKSERTGKTKKLIPEDTGLEWHEINRIAREQNAKKAREEWQPIGEVKYFEVCECQHCGSKVSLFRGFFQKQIHRQFKIDRYVKIDRALSRELPKQGIFNEFSYSEYCELCHENDAG